MRDDDKDAREIGACASKGFDEPQDDIEALRDKANARGPSKMRMGRVFASKLHGGGAENRTPVQSDALAGVSRLSRQ